MILLDTRPAAIRLSNRDADGVAAGLAANRGKTPLDGAARIAPRSPAAARSASGACCASERSAFGASGSKCSRACNQAAISRCETTAQGIMPDNAGPFAVSCYPPYGRRGPARLRAPGRSQRTWRSFTGTTGRVLGLLAAVRTGAASSALGPSSWVRAGRRRPKRARYLQPECLPTSRPQGVAGVSTDQQSTDHRTGGDFGGRAALAQHSPKGGRFTCNIGRICTNSFCIRIASASQLHVA